MEEKILKFLKENKDIFMSGEDISSRLKVSRTAVWKHIQNLRQAGYEISAQPHLGYQLVSIPDKMLPDEISERLNTKILGKKILSYASTTSTSDVACGLAEQASAEGTLIISEVQTKGKGRLGREWVSPEKGGLYLSLILRPEIMPSDAGQITLMSSVSIAKTIRSLTGLEALIKWPNDIFIDNEKICGILTEMNAEQDRINFIILGIGINVNTPAGKLPEGAASLKLKLGREVDRLQFLCRMLEDMERHYLSVCSNGFSDIMNEWRSFSMTLGKRIKIKWRQKLIEGQAMDVDDKGALIVRDDFGFLHHVLSGDVTVVR